MIVFPNAKINLGLDILRRRHDGFHSIDTIMVPVGWKDILEIVPAKGELTTLTLTGNALDCPMEKNLVYKAWKLMHDKWRVPCVDIYLHKVIPDGAGLGGGSSDAAFTLKLLADMFAPELNDGVLASVAGQLGSDCSFFIYNKPMRASGRGTILAPVELDLSPYKVLIAKPRGCSVSTAAAYGAVTPYVPPKTVKQLIRKPVRQWQGNLVNAFEGPVSAMYPPISRLLEIMRSSGAVYFSMSGSGSAVYGLFEKTARPDVRPFEDLGCDVFLGPMGRE